MWPFVLHGNTCSAEILHTYWKCICEVENEIFVPDTNTHISWFGQNGALHSMVHWCLWTYYGNLICTFCSECSLQLHKTTNARARVTRRFNCDVVRAWHVHNVHIYIFTTNSAAWNLENMLCCSPNPYMYYSFPWHSKYINIICIY